MDPPIQDCCKAFQVYSHKYEYERLKLQIKERERKRLEQIKEEQKLPENKK
jgi:hypothetical protein